MREGAAGNIGFVDDAPIRIETSDPADAPALLQLQRRCYRSEAALYDDWSLPPLTQSLAELVADYDTHCILAARTGDRLVGSVRARDAAGIVEIGRLAVAPEFQRSGVGSALMAAIERRFPPPTCFELFTGHRSEGNLRLYRRLGYVEHRRQPVSDRLQLVYLRKHVD
ncbi:MAG TPA: GNAT family N-acetyltransferase [Thermomicrobiales bacterium]|nr:GNAT family N-acetyltransferase [Thermomicrobiales bacterium]